ncbi:MAG: hypothetical protein HC800_01090 [Phormidesmis sp. RL_2_1]|nr:hypothetical protein [Phormidesmis sp. RL_2_1]
MMSIVIGINCLLTILILKMAHRLWHMRCRIAHLAARLQYLAQNAMLGPQQAGYVLAIKRAQIAETRLKFAQWQLRSRQIRQIIKMVELLRALVLYRAMYSRK